MLRMIRIAIATFMLLVVTALFLDFTGTVHAWLGWSARIQFLPALLALNAGVVVALIVLTLIMGRVYCSVICPLGIMQDVISWINGRRYKMKYRFSYSPAKNVLRYCVLGLFVLAMICGIGSVVALLAPYGAYGRIVSNLLAPIYQWGNNMLAYFSERAESYAFYEKDIWIRSATTLAVAAVTLITLGILAWRNGRTYCNTICPVGSVLGVLSRFSLLKLRIDTEKCISCGLCSRRCKAACIDGKAHRIDYSRCVVCMDCIDTCTHGAISYTWRRPKAADAPVEQPSKTEPADSSRRSFLTAAAIAATTTAIHAGGKAVDGGLAIIADKKVPRRTTRIVPPGALSLRNMEQHCTGCQLCVSVCPNGVLRPSDGLASLLQPESSYEWGYCRPECTRCSHVCPTGAIRPITRAEKSSIQIGHAVWIKQNCLPVTEGVACGNCARHCPTGAISMVPLVSGNPESLRIPSVDTERCIGCGACENLCPARPFSAIYVEGNERHRII